MRLAVPLLALLATLAGCAVDSRYGVSAYERGSYAMAQSYFQPLAVQGDPQAQYYLGAMSGRGLGGPRDDVAAARWFRLSAEQGYAESQYNLGELYANARGVPQDMAKAASWWRKAAAQGHAESQFELGVVYDQGLGVARDAAEAAKWYQLAADQGHVAARLKLRALSEDPGEDPLFATRAEVDSRCPYYRFYADFWSSGGSDESLALSRAVLVEFADALDGYPFAMARSVDDAYWRASALVSRSVGENGMAHGYINMRAFADFEGKALPYGHETLGGTLEYGLVFEQRVADIALFSRKSAEEFVDELLPHAQRKCDDWSTGQRREEARLRRIQKQLADEIQRIQRDREAADQDRELEFRVDEEPPEWIENPPEWTADPPAP